MGEMEINPKFRALSNQIQKMVMNNEQPPGLQADLDEESKSNNLSNAASIQKMHENAQIKQEKEARSIMEQYLAKAEPTQEDNEQAYSKMIQMQGF
jgi:hypothetical protein